MNVSLNSNAKTQLSIIWGFTDGQASKKQLVEELNHVLAQSLVQQAVRGEYFYLRIRFRSKMGEFGCIVLWIIIGVLEYFIDLVPNTIGVAYY